MLSNAVYFIKRHRYGVTQKPTTYRNSIPVGHIHGSEKVNPAFAYGTIDYPKKLSASSVCRYQLVYIGEYQEIPESDKNAIIRLRQIQKEMLLIADRLDNDYSSLKRRIRFILGETNTGTSLGDEIAYTYREVYDGESEDA